MYIVLDKNLYDRANSKQVLLNEETFPSKVLRQLLIRMLGISEGAEITKIANTITTIDFNYYYTTKYVNINSNYYKITYLKGLENFVKL